LSELAPELGLKLRFVDCGFVEFGFHHAIVLGTELIIELP
jgi:hypothetical protein